MKIIKAERKETATKIVNQITLELEQIETILLSEQRTHEAGAVEALRGEEREKLARQIVEKLRAACASLT